MPGGRRNVNNRSGQSSKSQATVTVPCTTVGRSNSGERSPANIAEDKKLEECSVGKSLAPKHVPMPVIAEDGQLAFEALSLAVSIIAASLQLLNIYRTVWWLPNSYNAYTMNFYLIDPYLIIFITTMISRRFVYTALYCAIEASMPTHFISITQKVMRVVLLVIVMSILGWCLYHMAEWHSFMKIFYLCYPRLSVYFLMFGMSVGPFFDISTTTSYVKDDRKMKFAPDKPLHNCSLNASAIRAEVANLRSDFNRRLKRALFASSGNAYICGIVPIIFVPQYLHFNTPWVLQHVVFFLLGRMSAHFIQAYPVRYCDVLHRAALHLGRWYKVENRNHHMYAQAWNDSVLWPHGSIVKYNKEVYRSEGLCTAAEPGNPNHYRFHALFNDPTVLLCTLLVLQLLLIGTQLFVLLGASEWYQVLSITLLIIMNYYTLFKLARDHFVCWKMYSAEQVVQRRWQRAAGPNTS